VSQFRYKKWAVPLIFPSEHNLPQCSVIINNKTEQNTNDIPDFLRKCPGPTYCGMRKLLFLKIDGEILQISLCPDNCVFRAYLQSGPILMPLQISFFLQKYKKGKTVETILPCDNTKMQPG
jgi:hypothetical protein